jgi:hypothetical protein
MMYCHHHHVITHTNSIDDELRARVEKKAQKLGVPFAEVAHTALRNDVAQARPVPDISAVFDAQALPSCSASASREWPASTAILQTTVLEPVSEKLFNWCKGSPLTPSPC